MRLEPNFLKTFSGSDYYREEQPILPAYDGTQGDLVLTLPAGVSTR